MKTPEGKRQFYQDYPCSSKPLALGGLGGASKNYFEKGACDTSSYINKDSSQVDKVPSARSFISMRSFNGKWVEIKEQRVIISESPHLKWAVVDDTWYIQAIFVHQFEAEEYLKQHITCKIIEIID